MRAIIWTATIAAAVTPSLAFARRSSGGGGDVPVPLVILGLLVFFGGIAWRMSTMGKVSVTRPDGTETEVGTADSQALAQVQTGPKKVQLGRSTMTFGYIEARHRAVNEIKMKYGSAIRILSRGKIGFGHGTKYTLVMEVGVRCPKCKESFAVEDFGYVDCPGCNATLAVYFSEKTKKKAIEVVSGPTVEVHAPAGAKVTAELPATSEPLTQEQAVKARFEKLG